MNVEGLAPARPAYVLRGHASQIHALSFSPDNARLLTGDADGWVTSWSLAYKRPVAAWRAHESTVLGLAWWEPGAVISHGRDSKLVVWKLGREDEDELDATLPVDQIENAKARPTVLFELTLNTMNFCSFAWCPDKLDETTQVDDGRQPVLLAVPHTLDSEAIDIFHLPSTNRLSTIPAPKTPAAGMAMALAAKSTPRAMMVAAGYESGHILVYANSSRIQQVSRQGKESPRTQIFGEDWKRLYLSNPHSQPILSLALAPDAAYFMTSAADSTIAKHPFRALLEAYQDVDGTVGQAEEQPLKIMKTKHSGQQGISIRDDGKIVATAGWDGRMRLYSTKNGKEVAVLKWHREGCYTTAFAHLQNTSADEAQTIGPLDSHTGEEYRLPPSVLESRAEARVEATSIVGLVKPGVDNSRDLRGTVAARRDRKAESTHWLAAGSKDGKVSLWDVY